MSPFHVYGVLQRLNTYGVYLAATSVKTIHSSQGLLQMFLLTLNRGRECEVRRESVKNANKQTQILTICVITIEAHDFK